MREDGGIRVLNSGTSIASGERDTAEGKAYFVTDEQTGHLKVSFFGPFYGSYVIFELDQEDYQYAFVTSTTRDYLWFLSRRPQVDQQLLDRFLQTTSQLGFDTSELIFVNHD